MKHLIAIGLSFVIMLPALSIMAIAEPTTKQSAAKKKKRQIKSKKAFFKPKRAKAKKIANEETAKLSTDINFNDSVLHGRYQTPDEATAKVENEKSLSDLLAVRTQFKDRLKKSAEQN